MNRKLKSEAILPEIKTLQNRITERFPTRSLSNVGDTLYSIGREAQQQAEEIAQPNRILRVSIALLVLSIFIVLLAALINLDVSINEFSLLDLASFIESAINDIIFIAAGIFFLTSIENRIKRKKTIKKLNELRTLAHVIDMHQLTKDPQRALSSGENTKSSPKEKMTAFELTRYLDYCSEMLSMIGKIAMLYMQNFEDEVVSGSVNEIETLTTGLSRKIWQKIMIVHQVQTTSKLDHEEISHT